MGWHIKFTNIGQRVVEEEGVLHAGCIYLLCFRTTGQKLLTLTH